MMWQIRSYDENRRVVTSVQNLRMWRGGSTEKWAKKRLNCSSFQDTMSCVAQGRFACVRASSFFRDSALIL